MPDIFYFHIHISEYTYFPCRIRLILFEYDDWWLIRMTKCCCHQFCWFILPNDRSEVVWNVDFSFDQCQIWLFNLISIIKWYDIISIIFQTEYGFYSNMVLDTVLFTNSIHIFNYSLNQWVWQLLLFSDIVDLELIIIRTQNDCYYSVLVMTGSHNNLVCYIFIYFIFFIG